MKIRTLVIDDEPIALDKLRAYVEKVPFLELSGACRSGLEAINFLSDNEVDVIFTDINMPDMSGMEFIGSLTKVPMVVFITAYADYAVDSYRFSAVDYILKPYSFADFQRAANKVLDRFNLLAGREAAEPAVTSRDGSIFVKVDYNYVRINLTDIRYIKGYGEYLQIFVAGSATPLLTLSSFGSVRERLTDNFIQVHRSYMVNMDCVKRISRGRIIMDDDTYIPVGDSYRAAFQSYLSTKSIGASSKR